MTKQEIADLIAEQANVPRTKAVDILDSMISAIIESMKNGDKVNITGLGIFEAKQKEARTARNPRTGESVQVPAKKVPKFKPSKGLKEALNN